MKRIVKLIGRWFLIVLLATFGILFIFFIVSRLAPGDPVLQHLPQNFTQEEYNEKRRELGLDQSFIIQYFYYIGNLFFGNWLLSWTILLVLSFAIGVGAAFLEKKYRPPKEN